MLNNMNKNNDEKSNISDSFNNINNKKGFKK